MPATPPAFSEDELNSLLSHYSGQQAAGSSQLQPQPEHDETDFLFQSPAAARAVPNQPAQPSSVNFATFDQLLAPGAGQPNPQAPAPSPTPVPAPAAPPAGRSFDDIDSIRNGIFDKSLAAAQQLEPVTNTRYGLSLHDVHYAGKDKFSMAEQKQALLSGGSLHRKLMGTWKLADATGNVISEKKSKLANIPYMTPRGTFILGGNEYTRCLHSSVKIWTEQGMLTIGEIVNNRLAIRIWTHNFETGKFELQTVLGWNKKRVQDGMGCSTFAKAARMSGEFKKFTTSTLLATPGHIVYDADGNKQPICDAKTLTVVEEQLSYTQEQLLYGTLLGDAHLRPDGIYSCCHGHKQLEYVKLKRAILAPVTTQEIRTTVHTRRGKKNIICSFWTTAHCAFHKARQDWYVGGRTIVTTEALEKIDEMGLAFWFGDDGSATYTRSTNHVTVSLHTQAFSDAEIKLLQQWLLNRWGIDTFTDRSTRYIGRDCGWIIRLSGQHATKFLAMVAPYLPEVLHYKLLARPKTNNCACGQEIKRTRQTCDNCLLTTVRNTTGALDKTIRYRFGGTEKARALATVGVSVKEQTGTEQWSARLQKAGTALPAMLADTTLRHVLVEVPHNYCENTGKSYEKAAFGYDIQVGNTHNYVANGVLVSNSHQLRLKPGGYTRQQAN